MAGPDFLSTHRRQRRYRNAARSRGVTEARLLTRYTVWAGLMAGVGLTLLYLALFRLGSDSATLVDRLELQVGKDNGVEVEILKGLSPDADVVSRYNGALADQIPVEAEQAKVASNEGGSH